MTVAVLEAYGPALIVHCVCQWLVENQVPAEFVARIPDDPLAVVDAGECVLPTALFNAFDQHHSSVEQCVHSKSVCNG